MQTIHLHAITSWMFWSKQFYIMTLWPTHESCILKASAVECRRIPSIDTLDWSSINTPSSLWLTLDWQTVDQVSMECWPSIDWDFDRALIKMSIVGIGRQLIADVISTHDHNHLVITAASRKKEVSLFYGLMTTIRPPFVTATSFMAQSWSHDYSLWHSHSHEKTTVQNRKGPLTKTTQTHIHYYLHWFHAAFSI